MPKFPLLGRTEHLHQLPLLHTTVLMLIIQTRTQKYFSVGNRTVLSLLWLVDLIRRDVISGLSLRGPSAK